MTDLSALSYLESTERTKLNQQAWEDIVAGESGTVTTPAGTVRKTLGQLEADAEARIANLSGFEPPVDYEADLEIETRSQTVSYQGVVYALRDAADAPYLTPETFDPTKWVVIVRPDSLLPVHTVTNVAALKQITAEQVATGTMVRTLGCSTIGFGAAMYRVILGSAASNGLTVNDGTILQNNAGTVTFVIDHEGPVRLAWFNPASDGETDDSAPMRGALLTGKSVALPYGRHTIIGTGTNLPPLVSYQCILSEVSAPIWNTTMTLRQSITVGTTTTRSDENAVGPGVRIIGSEGVTLFNIVYNRRFVLAAGVTCTGVHQLATLGSDAAAGASYVFYNFADVAARYARIVLENVTGAYTTTPVPETVTGQNSGAKATIEAFDAESGEMTLRLVSSTAFQVGEPVVGDSSGASSTVLTTYRPTHLVRVINHAGDFWSNGTVEGSYCGNANGLDISGNTHVRFDEFRIEKYWGRFQIGVEATNARAVNAHLYADMEGCLLYTSRFYTTTATTRPASQVGFANIYGRVKASVLAGGEAAFLFRNDRLNVESETVNLDIQTSDEHTVHCARILCAAGTVDSITISVNGSIIPATANQYGVDIIQSGTGAINGVDISTNLSQQGGNTLGASVSVVGSNVSGRIRKPVATGSVAKKINMPGTPPVNLRFDESEAGLPIGGSQKSEPFYFENIPTGSNTSYLKRCGLVSSWTVDRAIRITRAFAEYEGGTPTSGQLTFIIEVGGANAKADINNGQTFQPVRLSGAGTVYVPAGSVIKLKVVGTASYTAANLDVVAFLEYIDQYDEAGTA